MNRNATDETVRKSTSLCVRNFLETDHNFANPLLVYGGQRNSQQIGITLENIQGSDNLKKKLGAPQRFKRKPELEEARSRLMRESRLTENESV